MQGTHLTTKQEYGSNVQWYANKWTQLAEIEQTSTDEERDMRSHTLLCQNQEDIEDHFRTTNVHRAAPDSLQERLLITKLTAAENGRLESTGHICWLTQEKVSGIRQHHFEITKHAITRVTSLKELLRTHTYTKVGYMAPSNNSTGILRYFSCNL